MNDPDIEQLRQFIHEQKAEAKDKRHKALLLTEQANAMEHQIIGLEVLVDRIEKGHFA